MSDSDDDPRDSLWPSRQHDNDDSEEDTSWMPNEESLAFELDWDMKAIPNTSSSSSSASSILPSTSSTSHSVPANRSSIPSLSSSSLSSSSSSSSRPPWQLGSTPGNLSRSEAALAATAAFKRSHQGGPVSTSSRIGIASGIGTAKSTNSSLPPPFSMSLRGMFDDDNDTIHVPITIRHSPHSSPARQLSLPNSSNISSSIRNPPHPTPISTPGISVPPSLHSPWDERAIRFNIDFSQRLAPRQRTQFLSSFLKHLQVTCVSSHNTLLDANDLLNLNRRMFHQMIIGPRQAILHSRRRPPP